MADNARGIHVSPGIYSREVDLQYAVKSLGITTLGLVGETLRGPAFQPIAIENWRDFQTVFGGTSTEKFSGSQYPKYELPYIAKSYLSESNQLQVCRVLGLSGYNAGPAWVITAKATMEGTDSCDMVVAVLRSRGHYEKYHRFDRAEGIDECLCPPEIFDKLVYDVGEISVTSRNCNEPIRYNMSALKLDNYMDMDSLGNECIDYILNGNVVGFGVSSVNYGKFKIKGITGSYQEGTEPAVGMDGYFEYPVSLNPNDKDFILKVLGTSPSDGSAPIYVESLYDVALKQLIEENRITQINDKLATYNVYNKADFCVMKPVFGLMEKQENALTRKDVGKRFLADLDAKKAKITCHEYDYETNKPKTVKINETGDTVLSVTTVEVGQVYTVAQYTNPNGKRQYFYRFYNFKPSDEDADKFTDVKLCEINDKLSDKNSVTKFSQLVKSNEDGKYYRIIGENGDKDVYPVECDLNDYRDSYRFASTPWIVSNVKGDMKKIELTRMFRFHTISDGDYSNNEVKISIANIRPDDGTFDVIVRDINDFDEYPVVLERFTKCNMKPGDNNYIAYKIGSYDGVYETKSKYITVEVNESLVASHSVPAGFLGYPLSKFDGVQVDGESNQGVCNPYLKYNVYYDNNIKNRKQYFGLSTTVGVDIDSFTYKGNAAYDDCPSYLSSGFHLDSRLNESSYSSKDLMPKITVDGEPDYLFTAVDTNNRTNVLTETPIIAKESDMQGSIYEYVDLRKFTVYFYGGFDGWDVYRNSRSNTDEYKMSKYKGDYRDMSGKGYSFDKIESPELLGLQENGITSDWYAYLAAIRKFSNPEAVDINVFATPGIDIINNKLLVQEAIEMIEEERADSIYVATMPDKPFGASDFVDDMYTPDDVVYELEDTEIDSNYTCTYYPWVKYEDVENNQYIYLPPTKDVVRNMAITDNTTYPWFAPAGVSRGDVDCVRAHYITKLADEDILYDGRINPIKTFAADGVKVWGQKNLQVRESQLNRIAVRRLLLRMRKLISISCIGLIFEPNDATTKNKFLSTITPILDNIKANRGISDYKIEVNDTVEARERRELPAKIFFKPYNALEYIVLDFVITPESVSFDDI